MKPKGIIIFTVLFLMSAFAVFLYLKPSKSVNKQTANNQSSESNPEDIVVSAQTPTDKVIVEKVKLSKKGFLVAREMEGDKLSQVIEISKPLDEGIHNNIEIPLGTADVKGKELIAMIYEDFDNDGVFNDFDQPALDENGNMTARYVKTGKPLPSSVTEGDSMAAMGHKMAGMKSMVKVKYTDKGFIPEKIEVESGSMVQFVNESSKVMWVASSLHPQHTKLPTFDQFKPVKKGAIYRYVFDKKGVWDYHDHINPSIGGVVTVK